MEVWADGSCKNKIGAWCICFEQLGNKYIQRGSYRPSTNSLAELYAIRQAILLCMDYPEPCIIYSDSTYGINVCSGTHTARKNVDIVNNIMALITEHGDISLQYQEDTIDSNIRICHNYASALALARVEEMRVREKFPISLDLLIEIKELDCLPGDLRTRIERELSNVNSADNTTSENVSSL